jgi:hypothetical protein
VAVAVVEKAADMVEVKKTTAKKSLAKKTAQKALLKVKAVQKDHLRAIRTLRHLKAEAVVSRALRLEQALVEDAVAEILNVFVNIVLR